MPRHRLTRSATLGTAGGLGVLGLALSYAPPSVVGALPPPLQKAVASAEDMRAEVTAMLTGNAQQTASHQGALPRVPSRFSAAKNILYEHIYTGQAQTFYCGCSYSDWGEVDLASCGMDQYGDNQRALRVEAEHVFPASQFGHFRQCWRQPEAYTQCREADGDVISGRDCCQRVDPVFTAAHNDLHNLVPAVGLVNGARSNYNWGMSAGVGADRYGACPIRINSNLRRVEPPEAVRGDIARTMLYMAETYGFALSRQDQQLYAAWHQQDPPDAWERERNRRIARVQGRGNRFIEEPAAR